MDQATVSEVGAFLRDQIRRRPIGEGAALWNLDVLLPLAPSVEEALRIAMQHWDGETVEFYICDNVKRAEHPRLVLVKGQPVTIDGVGELCFGAYTDVDHRYRWSVTEISTGMALTGPKASFEEAVGAAAAAVKKSGAGSFIDLIRTTHRQMSYRFENSDFSSQAHIG